MNKMHDARRVAGGGAGRFDCVPRVPAAPARQRMSDHPEHIHQRHFYLEQ